MGGAKKPFLTLAGEPLLVHSLRPFLARKDVVAVAVAVSPEDVEEAAGWVEALDPRIRVVAGGDTRSDSVAHGVAALPLEVDVILVHDAARPLVTEGAIQRCVAAASAGEGAVAGWPATDTLNEVDASGRIVATPDRDRIWHAQTPQGFPASVLRGALEDAELRARATDDASLVEAAGTPVRMVEGSADNLKVTRPQDLPVAEVLLSLRRRES
jgi:2-C-methyl-D-erythritol 4-phosphate cytidylyltransferase